MYLNTWRTTQKKKNKKNKIKNDEKQNYLMPINF